MLLVEVAVKIISESESCSAMSNCLLPHGVYSPWNSPGQNTGMGTSRSLLQGIFPTQGSNPGLPHCRWILYQLSHQGNPKILEWVAYPFCSGSSPPKNQTGVSCIAGGFFTNWAFREAWYLFLENEQGTETFVSKAQLGKTNLSTKHTQNCSLVEIYWFRLKCCDYECSYGLHQKQSGLLSPLSLIWIPSFGWQFPFPFLISGLSSRASFALQDKFSQLSSHI